MATDAKGESPIYSDILGGRRQYFIDKVKAPLVSSMVKITGGGNGFLGKILLLWDVWILVRSVLRYPEPTKENTEKHMSHILLDTFDEFERYNKVKPAFFRAIRRIVISTCEHDDDESQRMTWFVKRLSQAYLSGEWPPLQPWTPFNGWSDPEVLAHLKVARKEFSESLTVNGVAVGSIET